MLIDAVGIRPRGLLGALRPLPAASARRRSSTCCAGTRAPIAQTLVVDLGCGTGLSTRTWSGTAARDGRRRAEPRRCSPRQSRPPASTTARRSPPRPAWTTPAPTSSRARSPCTGWSRSRRLRRSRASSGAAESSPPTTTTGRPSSTPMSTRPSGRIRSDAASSRRTLGIQIGADRWAKEEHLSRMRASGRFRYCREVLLHSIEESDAERVGGFARSFGLPFAGPCRRAGGAELRIDELEAVARRVLGDRTVPFLFGYRVRIGVT